MKERKNVVWFVEGGGFGLGFGCIALGARYRWFDVTVAYIEHLDGREAWMRTSMGRTGQRKEVVWVQYNEVGIFSSLFRCTESLSTMFAVFEYSAPVIGAQMISLLRPSQTGLSIIFPLSPLNTSFTHPLSTS